MKDIVDVKNRADGKIIDSAGTWLKVRWVNYTVTWVNKYERTETGWRYKILAKDDNHHLDHNDIDFDRY